MVRPQLHEVLGHVVHARMEMETLKAAVIEEMRAGYRPTYRGHAWGPETYAALDGAAWAIETAFSLLKLVQFPEGQFRLEDAREAWSHLGQEEGPAMLGGPS